MAALRTLYEASLKEQNQSENANPQPKEVDLSAAVQKEIKEAAAQLLGTAKFRHKIQSKEELSKLREKFYDSIENQTILKKYFDQYSPILVKKYARIGIGSYKKDKETSSLASEATPKNAVLTIDDYKIVIYKIIGERIRKKSQEEKRLLDNSDILEITESLSNELTNQSLQCRKLLKFFQCSDFTAEQLVGIGTKVINSYTPNGRNQYVKPETKKRPSKTGPDKNAHKQRNQHPDFTPEQLVAVDTSVDKNDTPSDRNLHVEPETKKRPSKTGPDVNIHKQRKMNHPFFAAKQPTEQSESNKMAIQFLIDPPNSTSNNRM